MHTFKFFYAYQVPSIRDMHVLRKHLVATWLNVSRAWWTLQLISGEKDWKHVSVQKVVTLNICCNVACLTFHLPHITTGSFQSHQCQPTTGFFSEPATFGGMQHTFSQMKKLCIFRKQTGSILPTFFLQNFKTFESWLVMWESLLLKAIRKLLLKEDIMLWHGLNSNTCYLHPVILMNLWDLELATCLIYPCRVVRNCTLTTVSLNACYYVKFYFTELCTVNLDLLLTGSGETLARYFSGAVDSSTVMNSWCLLSSFLTWYNVPHPKALAQMGLTGTLMPHCRSVFCALGFTREMCHLLIQ